MEPVRLALGGLTCCPCALRPSPSATRTSRGRGPPCLPTCRPAHLWTPCRGQPSAGLRLYRRAYAQGSLSSAAPSPRGPVFFPYPHRPPTPVPSQLVRFSRSSRFCPWALAPDVPPLSTRSASLRSAPLPTPTLASVLPPQAPYPCRGSPPELVPPLRPRPPFLPRAVARQRRGVEAVGGGGGGGERGCRGKIEAARPKPPPRPGP